MRKIKFRSWTGPWASGKYRMIYSGDLREEGNADNFTFDNGILMQYTGLRDKNGTEIYEGDIVKWTRVTFEDCSRTVIEKTEYIIGEVYWVETMWAIRRDGAGYRLMPYFVESDEFEVLGNKYEHPHLLGGEEE
jgi:uncharacterized phage protein (TIGR01671 family)